ncbi:unnamed protein product [Calicophoron daubneyi]|uniref:Band 7 domain-containing protein n=1 Tax=Calicophoron daubneyi TaxID=300641 RepID=A0AAV2U1X5_CALDB
MSKKISTITDEECGLQESSHQRIKQWEDDEGGPGFFGFVLILLSIILFVVTLPVAIFFSFKIIKTYERAVVLRLGKLARRNGNPVLGAGVQFILPCIDDILRVDLRTRTVNIPPQDVLTRDAVTVNVDAIVYMRVVEPAYALLRVEDASKSAELLAVSMLRTVFGSYELVHVLTARDEIDARLQQLLDEATDAWGIRVERVEIKDVSLPQDMQRAMAAEAQATRAARAKVIAAQGELDASETLRLAASQMAVCPTALQLRYLQTLATIATEQNSTIIFPLPIELLSAFNPKKNN